MAAVRLLQVIDEAQRALAWLQEKEDLQQRVAKHEDPVLLSSDIRKKEDTLKRVAEPILTKPPPAPKVLSVCDADLWPQIGPRCILALWPVSPQGCCPACTQANRAVCSQSNAAAHAQKEEPKPEMPAEPEATATGEQSSNGVPPEGASEPSKVDIEEVDPESSTPMDS